MKKSAFYSDLSFNFFITALFTLCLFRYLGISLWLSFLLATVCGVLAAMGVGALLQSKRNRLFLKKSDEKILYRFGVSFFILSKFFSAFCEKIVDFFLEIVYYNQALCVVTQYGTGL